MTNEAPVAKKHLVVTVHGIRTFGFWQSRLEGLLKRSDPTIETVNYTYGYFSVLAFLLPFLRWIVARRFRQQLLSLCDTQEWDRIDLVGHSFGTYLIGAALRRIPTHHGVHFHTIVLAGSVLRSTFPWHRLLGSRVHRVINECGVADSVLILSQIGSVGTGMAGRVGFSGISGTMFRNRFFNFGHSGYFLAGGKPDDAFMRRYWVPLLVEADAEIEAADERGVPTALQGALHVVLNNFEPVKALFYALPFALATWSVFGLYANARFRLERVYAETGATQLLQGEYAKAAVLLGTSYGLGNGDPSLRYLLGRAIEPIDALIETVEGPEVGGEPISRVAFSRDGSRMVGVDAPGAAYVWDAAQGETLRRVVPPNDRFAGVRIDPRGELLLAVTSIGTSHVYDIATGASVAFAARALERWRVADNATLVVGGARGPTWWEYLRRPTRTNREVRVHWAIQSADGRLRLQAPTGPDDPWLLLDLTRRGGQVALTGSSDLGDLPAFRFSADGEFVVVASCRTVIVWDRRGNVVSSPEDSFYECAEAHISDDGQWLAAGGDRSEMVSVYDARGGAALWQVPSPGGVRSVAFSPDSQRLLVASTDDLVRVWDVPERRPRFSYFSGPSVSLTPPNATGDRVATLHGGNLLLWRGPSDGRHQVPGRGQFASGGKRFVSWTDDRIALTDVETGENIATWRSPVPGRLVVALSAGLVAASIHGAGPTQTHLLALDTLVPWPSVAAPRVIQGDTVVSTDSTRALVWTGGSARVLDLASGRFTPSVPSDWRREFVGDGSAFVTSTDEGLFLRRSVDAAELRPMPAESVFSDDGKFVAGYEGECSDASAACVLAVTRLPGGEPVVGFDRATLQPGEGDVQLGTIFGFSPGNRYLVAGATGGFGLVVLDLERGDVRTRFEEPEAAGTFARIIERLTFSPDGEHIGTTHGDLIYDASGMPKIWNLDEGRVVAALNGATGLGSRIVFSNSGGLAATFGGGQVRLWSARDGQLLGRYDGRGVEFSADGRHLAIQGTNHTTLVPAALEARDPDVLMAEICRRSAWRVVDGVVVPASQVSDERITSCTTPSLSARALRFFTGFYRAR